MSHAQIIAFTICLLLWNAMGFCSGYLIGKNPPQLNGIQIAALVVHAGVAIVSLLVALRALVFLIVANW